MTPRIRWVRVGFAALAWLFLAGVVAQVFLLGLHAFEAGVPESLHRDFAYTYGWLLPVMLLLGRLARVAATLQMATLLLLVLYAVQTALPVLRDQIPIAGPVHAANALVLFGLAILVAQRATRELRPETGGPRSLGTAETP